MATIGNGSSCDRDWIGHSLFSDKKGKLTSNLKLCQLTSTKTLPNGYYWKWLFLWMPRRMWMVNFKSPNCPGQLLRSKGVYNHVRLVMDLRDFFYLAAEYMDCRECNGTTVKRKIRVPRSSAGETCCISNTIPHRKYSILFTNFTAIIIVYQYLDVLYKF